MGPLTLKQRQPSEEAIENWDDDTDFKDLDDLHFRHASSTTVASSQAHRRDSISSRMSTRSDRESAADEDWQVLLAADDEKPNADAISSAKSAGIPIPQNVPTSALLGGTIKRLGGRRIKKALVDDWGDDIEIPKPQEGGLKLKKPSEAECSDPLRGFSTEFPSMPSPSKPQSKTSFMSRLASATKATTKSATLEKFKDEDDDFFGDVQTIKVPKSRPSQKPINFTLPTPIVKKDAENMEEDLEFPDDGKPLKLSLRKDTPKTPASNLTDDLDLDWAEGSLGTRFGGTRRDMRSNHSSSISAFSPSASSCLTADSEDDHLEGLVLPDSNFKFGEALKKRMENVPTDQPEPKFEKSPPKPVNKQDRSNKEDFFSEIDIGDGEVFDSGKLTLNRNIKHKTKRPISPAKRSAMTLTFTNKIDPGPSRIPRPQSHDRPRPTLESVSESGPAPQYGKPGPRLGSHSSHPSSSGIPAPSTPSSHTTAPSTPSRRGLNTKSSLDTLRAQNTSNPSNYLKAQRSIPALLRSQPSPARQSAHQRPPSRGGDYGGSRQALPSRPKTPVDRAGAESSMSNARKPPMPFLPAGTSHSQSHHISAKSSRHFSRPTSSDSNENAPINRPLSRLSHSQRPTTPTNNRHAPESLTREAASKRTLTKPTRRRAFGDGNELEIFDDLPTSASNESKFMKQPIARGAPKSVQMRSKLGLQGNTSSTSLNEQVQSPAGPTPLSPIKNDALPRFARDTNASRLAREQRIGSVSATFHAPPSLPTVRETGGPLSSINTNWKPPMHISQKTPTSPMPRSKRRPKAPPQKPRLIRPMGEVNSHAKEEKGMRWNPSLFCWEGNENALAPFDVPPPFQPATCLSSPLSPKSSATKAAPALIANVGAAKGVQMSGGMVFDPQRMCWLKAAPTQRAGGSNSNPRSPDVGGDDDDDPFAGLDDLDDKPNLSSSKSQVDGLDNFSGSLTLGSGAGLGKGETSLAAEPVEPLVLGEEFDVGPEFVKRLRAEEERWRSKVEAWVGESVRRDDEERNWRWAIREKATGYAAGNDG